MADRQLSGQVPPRAQADARDARRQGLRCQVGRAHEGLGPACLDDRPPLRGRLRAARPQPAQAQADHRSLRPAAQAAAAAELVLTGAMEVQMPDLAVSVVALGVSDLARSVAFYEGLG